MPNDIKDTPETKVAAALVKPIAVLIVAANAEGKPVRILRQITRGGTVLS
jgi:hypothetical protein